MGRGFLYCPSPRRSNNFITGRRQARQRVAADQASVKKRKADRMRRVESSWKLLEEVLWEHAHSVYKALCKPASDATIKRLEKILGKSLPADFRQSLRIHDGLSETDQPCLFDGKVLLSSKRIASEWKMRCKVHGDDDPGGCPDTKDRRIKNDRWWRPGWVPVMEQDGDMPLMDLDPGPGGKRGQIFRFRNNGGRPREVIAPTFKAWLSKVADELRHATSR